MIIGFDVSTSIIGISCIDEEGRIIFCDHCDLRKHQGLFTKTDVFKKYLEDHRYLQAVVREVWIEQPFTFFRAGGSSAKTMAILQRFNGMVSLLVRDVYGVEPQYIEAARARKLNNIKIPRGTKAKEEVLKYILDTVEGFHVEYTKHGNPRPGYGDRADSLVVANAGLSLWKQKSLTS